MTDTAEELLRELVEPKWGTEVHYWRGRVECWYCKDSVPDDEILPHLPTCPFRRSRELLGLEREATYPTGLAPLADVLARAEERVRGRGKIF